MDVSEVTNEVGFSDEEKAEEFELRKRIVKSFSHGISMTQQRRAANDCRAVCLSRRLLMSKNVMKCRRSMY